MQTQPRRGRRLQSGLALTASASVALGSPAALALGPTAALALGPTAALALGPTAALTDKGHDMGLQHHAVTARTVSLVETGRLHLTSKHNFTLNEQGSATGTFAGTIYVRLTAVSTSRVTVQVSIRPRGGSVTGSGSGGYRREGSIARFSGTMSLGSGSGRYAAVHGSGLSFSGTIEESNRDAITVRLKGLVSA